VRNSRGLAEDLGLLTMVLSLTGCLEILKCVGIVLGGINSHTARHGMKGGASRDLASESQLSRFQIRQFNPYLALSMH
jgi:hypothetical protein